MKTGPPARARGLTPWITLAVALLAGGVLWATNPGPQWRVAETQRADGNVLFDDDPVPATDAEAMDALLMAGTTIEWQGHGDLEVISPGHALLAVAPGTVLTLPAPPPRWFARASACSLSRGTLRFVPGPRFRGARLTFVTPARAFTAGGNAAFEIAHDPVTVVTRIDASGPGITEFARVKRTLLAR